MKSKIWALFVKSRLLWVLAAAIALGAPVPAAAAAGRPGQQIAASWGSYHPKGWAAGAVARGTGYWRPGASRRVREVQRRLDRLGYATGEVDGFFGPITDAAVRNYQRDSVLRPDGIVGPRTLRDLRSRTRRAQGPADRETSPARPGADRGSVSQETRRDHAAGPSTATKRERSPMTAVWSKRQRATSSPEWWPLVPLLAAALAIALVGTGLLLRALSGAGTAAGARSRLTATDNGGGAAIAESPPEAEVAFKQAKPGTATHPRFLATAGGEQAFGSASMPGSPAGAVVTAMSSRRRKSRPAESVASHASGRRPGYLQILRRIERGSGARSGRTRRPRRRPEGNRHPDHFSVFGARIHLSQGRQPLDSPNTLLVELELFVEGDERRWETGLIEHSSPFRVSLGDLEESVRAFIVPDCLPALAHALVREGLEVSPEDLSELTFAIELSIEAERVIAERNEVFPIAG
jgi:hypothetical protein